jgi:antitoxin (DNA-binding transcriptional repressor) of toxin-antitoxin stability system
MKTLESDQATASLVEYARAAKSEPVILTEQGNPIAEITAIEDVDVEALSLGSNPQFLAIIERARARLAAEAGIPSEEMRRRLELGERRG